MSKIKRVIISCGGTAGHIFPGLEIAKSLKKFQKEKSIVLFVGAIGKMEMKSVPKHGFKIKGIWIQSLNRKLVFFKYFISNKIEFSLKVNKKFLLA